MLGPQSSITNPPSVPSHASSARTKPLPPSSREVWSVLAHSGARADSPIYPQLSALLVAAVARTIACRGLCFLPLPPPLRQLAGACTSAGLASVARRLVLPPAGHARCGRARLHHPRPRSDLSRQAARQRRCPALRATCRRARGCFSRRLLVAACILALPGHHCLCLLRTQPESETPAVT